MRQWSEFYSGTINVGLAFKKDVMGKQECIRYVESIYAGDINKCRSTTGCLFTLFQAPISWCFTLQSTVTLSTSEAEYMIMTEAMKETIWLQKLLDDLGINHDLSKINLIA